MKYNKIMVWWLVIIINTLDNIYFSSASIPTLFADQLRNILKSCFADRLNPLIINKDLIDIVYKEETNFPILVIKENFKAKAIEGYFNPRYPTYVLAINSIKKLETILQELATLSMWSVNSILLIVRYSEIDCNQEGRKVLEILEKMNQLMSFYICSKSGKSIETNNNGTQTIIYTANYFSNRAPSPWQKVPHNRLINSNQDQNGSLTLYKRPYENDSKLCPSLKFEKTKNLDGYPIKAVTKFTLKTKLSHNKTLKLENLDNNYPYAHYKFFDTLFSILNVSLIINYYTKVGNYKNNKTQDSLNGLINGTHDICLDINMINDPNYKFFDIIDPICRNTLFILSHKNGTQMPIKSNFNFINYKIVLIYICALVTFYIVIVINNFNVDDNPEYGNSFLDTIRLIVSIGIITPLNRLSIRFMFVTMTLLVFVVSPYLQGKITSLSTKHEYKYPTTIKELFDLKYDVCIHPGLKSEISERIDEFNTNPDRLYAPIDFINQCHKRILNDSNTASVFLDHSQIEMAFKYDFPLSVTPEITRYRFFWSKKNWSLKNKIDEIIMRLHENGFIEYWVNKDIYLPLKKLKLKKANKPKFEYNPTEFDDLKQPYYWLAFLALGFSLFVFLLEIIVAKIGGAKTIIDEKMIQVENLTTENYAK